MGDQLQQGGDVVDLQSGRALQPRGSELPAAWSRPHSRFYTFVVPAGDRSSSARGLSIGGRRTSRRYSYTPAPMTTASDTQALRDRPSSRKVVSVRSLRRALSHSSTPTITRSHRLSYKNVGWKVANAW